MMQQPFLVGADTKPHSQEGNLPFDLSVNWQREKFSLKLRGLSQ